MMLSGFSDPKPVSQRCETCSGYEEKIDPTTGEIAMELAEMQKHDILCHIATIIGDDPEHLAQAEQIFDTVKYHMAQFVLKHEYNESNRLSVQLALWLEERMRPSACESLHGFISKYLKR